MYFSINCPICDVTKGTYTWSAPSSGTDLILPFRLPRSAKKKITQIWREANDGHDFSIHIDSFISCKMNESITVLGAELDISLSIQAFSSHCASASCPLFNPADWSFSPGAAAYHADYFSLLASAQEIKERPHRFQQEINGMGGSRGEVIRSAAGRLSRRCVIKSNPGTLLRGRCKLLSLCQRSETLFVGSLVCRRTHKTHAESLFFPFSLPSCRHVHNSFFCTAVLKAHKGSGGLEEGSLSVSRSSSHFRRTKWWMWTTWKSNSRWGLRTFSRHNQKSINLSVRLQDIVWRKITFT